MANTNPLREYLRGYTSSPSPEVSEGCEKALEPALDNSSAISDFRPGTSTEGTKPEATKGQSTPSFHNVSTMGERQEVDEEYPGFAGLEESPFDIPEARCYVETEMTSDNFNDNTRFGELNNDIAEAGLLKMLKDEPKIKPQAPLDITAAVAPASIARAPGVASAQNSQAPSTSPAMVRPSIASRSQNSIASSQTRSASFANQGEPSAATLNSIRIPQSRHAYLRNPPANSQAFVNTNNEAGIDIDLSGGVGGDRTIRKLFDSSSMPTEPRPKHSTQPTARRLVFTTPGSVSNQAVVNTPSNAGVRGSQGTQPPSTPLQKLANAQFDDFINPDAYELTGTDLGFRDIGASPSTQRITQTTPDTPQATDTVIPAQRPVNLETTHTYPVIRCQHTGGIIPRPTLDELRSVTDPGFVNDESWGDDFYFSDEYRPSPRLSENPSSFAKTDWSHTWKGLNMQANRIPIPDSSTVCRHSFEQARKSIENPCEEALATQMENKKQYLATGTQNFSKTGAHTQAVMNSGQRLAGDGLQELNMRSLPLKSNSMLGDKDFRGFCSTATFLPGRNGPAPNPRDPRSVVAYVQQPKTHQQSDVRSSIGHITSQPPPIFGSSRCAEDVDEDDWVAKAWAVDAAFEQIRDGPTDVPDPTGDDTLAAFAADMDKVPAHSAPTQSVQASTAVLQQATIEGSPFARSAMRPNAVQDPNPSSAALRGGGLVGMNSMGMAYGSPSGGRSTVPNFSRPLPPSPASKHFSTSLSMQSMSMGQARSPQPYKATTSSPISTSMAGQAGFPHYKAVRGESGYSQGAALPSQAYAQPNAVIGPDAAPLRAQATLDAATLRGYGSMVAEEVTPANFEPGSMEELLNMPTVLQDMGGPSYSPTHALGFDAIISRSRGQAVYMPGDSAQAASPRGCGLENMSPVAVQHAPMAPHAFSSLADENMAGMDTMQSGPAQHPQGFSNTISSTEAKLALLQSISAVPVTGGAVGDFTAFSHDWLRQKSPDDLEIAGFENGAAGLDEDSAMGGDDAQDSVLH